MVRSSYKQLALSFVRGYDLWKDLSVNVGFWGFGKKGENSRLLLDNDCKNCEFGSAVSGKRQEKFSNMEQNEDFARLEQFVEKLIESHNQLKKEKNEMMAQMQERLLEIADLQEKIKNLQEDKSRIQNRVTGLINKIDEWEKMLDLEEGGRKKSSGSGAPREQPKKSSSLFNVKPEHSSKPALR